MMFSLIHFEFLYIHLLPSLDSLSKTTYLEFCFRDHQFDVEDLNIIISSCFPFSYTLQSNSKITNLLFLLLIFAIDSSNTFDFHLIHSRSTQIDFRNHLILAFHLEIRISVTNLKRMSLSLKVFYFFQMLLKGIPF